MKSNQHISGSLRVPYSLLPRPRFLINLQAQFGCLDTEVDPFFHQCLETFVCRNFLLDFPNFLRMTKLTQILRNSCLKEQT